MGLSNMEARFLSAEGGTEEIPESLRDATKHSRSEFYFSSTGQRIDDPELAAKYARALSFRRKGPSGHHSHQAAQGDRRLCAAISGDHRTAGRGGQAGACAVSASAKPEDGCRFTE